MQHLERELADLIDGSDPLLREIVQRDQAAVLATGGEQFRFLGRALARDKWPSPEGITVVVTDAVLHLVGDVGFPVSKIRRVAARGTLATVSTPLLADKEVTIDFATPATARAFVRVLRSLIASQR